MLEHFERWPRTGDNHRGRWCRRKPKRTARHRGFNTKETVSLEGSISFPSDLEFWLGQIGIYQSSNTTWVSVAKNIVWPKLIETNRADLVPVFSFGENDVSKRISPSILCSERMVFLDF